MGWVVGWGHSDVNSKRAHAKTTCMHSILDDFAWVNHDPVKHVPPQPSSS